MKGHVTSIKANPSMHEVTISIEFGEQIGNLKCYAFSLSVLETDFPSEIEVISDDDVIKKIVVGRSYDFKLEACFVTSYQRIEKVRSNIEQIGNTCSIKFQGTVQKVIDEDFVCRLDSISENIYVIYEDSTNDLMIGEIIEFTGELKVEPSFEI